jgi:hypothetical protein
MEHDTTRYDNEQTPQDRQHQAPPPPPPPPPAYSRRDLPLKSTPFTVVLSAIMPGLGQVYVGYYKQAFTYIIIFASVITLLASGDVNGMEPLLGIFLGYFYFYQLIDAGRKASLYNQVLERGEAADLAVGELPDSGGAMFGGWVLMIVGIFALANTVFDVSLQWLEDWWPLGLVAAGGWLIYRSRQDRGSED